MVVFNHYAKGTLSTQFVCKKHGIYTICTLQFPSRFTLSIANLHWIYFHWNGTINITEAEAGVGVGGSYSWSIHISNKVVLPGHAEKAAGHSSVLAHAEPEKEKSAMNSAVDSSADL